jgi:hypothetical protein
MTEDRSELPRNIRHLLARLIRGALLMDQGQRQIERAEALRLHALVRESATPEHLAALQLDGLWSAAVREAEAPELGEEPLRVSMQFPATCPLGLADLVAPGLAPSELEQRIRESAATG